MISFSRDDVHCNVIVHIGWSATYWASCVIEEFYVPLLMCSVDHASGSVVQTQKSACSQKVSGALTSTLGGVSGLQVILQPASTWLYVFDMRLMSCGSEKHLSVCSRR